MQLNGMNEICQHVGFSESTILIWIRTKDFPARKVTGSWISDTDKIKEWRFKFLDKKKAVKRKVQQ